MSVQDLITPKNGTTNRWSNLYVNSVNTNALSIAGVPIVGGDIVYDGTDVPGNTGQVLTLSSDDGSTANNSQVKIVNSDISNVASITGESATNVSLAHFSGENLRLNAANTSLSKPLDLSAYNVINGSSVTSTTFVGALTGHASADLKIDGTSTMTGNLNMGGHRINQVVDPSANQDAATKVYVDNAVFAGTKYTNVIYRPGGVAGDNVYTSWTAILAVASTVNNAINIYIDDSIVTPAQIDVSYDFGGTANIMSYTLNTNTVNTCMIIDTVTISNPRSWSGNLNVLCIALTFPSIQLDSGNLMLIENGVLITNSNTSASSGINITTGSTITLNNSAIQNNGVPTIILPSSATLNLNIYNGSSVQNSTISSIDGSSFLNISYDASFNAVALTNVGFTGTLTTNRIDAAVNVSYNDTLAFSGLTGATQVQAAIDWFKTGVMLINGFNQMSGDMGLGDNNIQYCHNINSIVRGYALVLGNATDGVSIPGSTNCNAQPILNCPNVCVCWGSVDSSGTLLNSYNVASINKFGTGSIQITFTTALSSAIFSVTANPWLRGFFPTVPLFAQNDNASKSTTGFNLYAEDSTGALTDCGIDFVVFGQF